MDGCKYQQRLAQAESEVIWVRRRLWGPERDPQLCQRSGTPGKARVLLPLLPVPAHAPGLAVPLPGTAVPSVQAMLFGAARGAGPSLCRVPCQRREEARSSGGIHPRRRETSALQPGNQAGDIARRLFEVFAGIHISTVPLGEALFTLISRQGLAIKSFLTPLCTVRNNK